MELTFYTILVTFLLLPVAAFLMKLRKEKAERKLLQQKQREREIALREAAERARLSREQEKCTQFGKVYGKPLQGIFPGVIVRSKVGVHKGGCKNSSPSMQNKSRSSQPTTPSDCRTKDDDSFIPVSIDIGGIIGESRVSFETGGDFGGGGSDSSWSSVSVDSDE